MKMIIHLLSCVVFMGFLLFIGTHSSTHKLTTVKWSAEPEPTLASILEGVRKVHLLANTTAWASPDCFAELAMTCPAQRHCEFGEAIWTFRTPSYRPLMLL